MILITTYVNNSQRNPEGWDGEEVGSGGSGWGAHVHPWQIQVNVWQNQYNAVK